MTAQAANGKTGATGSAVWDLKAAAAAQAAANEADDADFPFAYEGKTYTFPPQRRWPARVTAAFSAGQLDKVLIELLGQQAWDQLCDDGLVLGELNVLMEQVAIFNGFDTVPNSGPPARPNSTRR